LLLIIPFGLAGCRADQGSTSDAAQAQAKWWYDIQFTPVSDSVFGLAADEIDARWQYASTLTLEDLTERITAKDVNAFRESEFSFQTAADLDQDGIDELILVGVYADQDGATGRFLTILREGALAAKFAEGGGAGFTALMKIDGDVRWYKCMDCGEFETLRWTGEAYVLE
jgi:hypothetical protein